MSRHESRNSVPEVLTQCRAVSSLGSYRDACTSECSYFILLCYKHLNTVESYLVCRNHALGEQYVRPIGSRSHKSDRDRNSNINEATTCCPHITLVDRPTLRNEVYIGTVKVYHDALRTSFPRTSELPSRCLRAKVDTLPLLKSIPALSHCLSPRRSSA